MDYTIICKWCVCIYLVTLAVAWVVLLTKYKMQMQSTYWLEKVPKMISLYVIALLCTLQHIVTHAMQLSGVNSPTLVYETVGRFFVRHPVVFG